MKFRDTPRFLLSSIRYQLGFLRDLKKKDVYETVEEIVETAFSSRSGIVRPIQVKSEIIDLLTIVKREEPKTIVEIGTANGGTLFLLSRAVPADAQMICIDLPCLPMRLLGWSTALIRTLFFRAFLKPKQHLDMLWADSHKKETAAKVRKLLSGKKIDLLFIDGDHSYHGVKTDFERYLPMVKEDGIIVFHDIVFHPPGCFAHPADVDIFWKEIRKRYPHVELVENWNQIWAGLGIVTRRSFFGKTRSRFTRGLKTAVNNGGVEYYPVLRSFGRVEATNSTAPAVTPTIPTAEICIPIWGGSPLFFPHHCEAKELSKLELFFGTYKRINPGNLCLKVYETSESRTLLRSASLDAASLEDNRFAAFDFEPIEDSQGKTFQLSLEIDNAKPTHLVGLWHAAIDLHSNTEAA